MFIFITYYSHHICECRFKKKKLTIFIVSNHNIAVALIHRTPCTRIINTILLLFSSFLSPPRLVSKHAHVRKIRILMYYANAYLCHVIYILIIYTHIYIYLYVSIFLPARFLITPVQHFYNHTRYAGEFL